ncbi:MAG: hypothetical protein RLZZ230_356 [Candidatus Parcubacteria bacterium]|jgi:hypothetical protein
MENHTAKHFVLQLGSLISLYLSVSFLLVLLFGLINILFPDATEGVWGLESASNSVRIGIAMTFVFFPTYLILTRIVNKTRRKDTKSNYLGLTKWLIYLSLLVGGGVLLGDLVTVIMTFLDGDITQRFVLKALAVSIIVGAAFYYYLLDAKGYWLKEEKKSVRFGIGAAVIVLISLVYGFMNIATPTEVREKKLDDTQITNLQDMQWHIQDYLTLKNELPKTVAELYKGVPVPEAPEGRAAYRYEIIDTGFMLCATFMANSETGRYANDPMMNPVSVGDFKPTAVNLDGTIAESVKTKIVINPDNWEHGTGEVCFERVVK